MTTENPLPAEVGRYRIERELGRGAMGRVLLATDPVLRREVAIKHLRSDLALPPEQRRALLERMSQEARASARVNHPHLVALFDMGEDAELGLYLVFEYVEGPTLADRLEQSPLPTTEAARLVRELGEALSYAHGRGIVHRDVKPENVILSAAGSKLADFGIARLPDSTLTQGNGIVLGTPAYSAPEALRGAKFSPLSDQFSLGATMYEAVSGRRPFPGEDALAVAARIANDEPPRVAQRCGLDRTVDMVFAKVLSKTARQRFQSCAEFGAALADALVGPAARAQGSSETRRIRAQQPTLPDQFHVERSARPSFAWTLGIALASAGATIALGTFFTPARIAAGKPRHEVALAPVVAEEDPAPVAWLARSPEDDETDETSAPAELPPRELSAIDHDPAARRPAAHGPTPKPTARAASAVRPGGDGASVAATP